MNIFSYFKNLFRSSKNSSNTKSEKPKASYSKPTPPSRFPYETIIGEDFLFLPNEEEKNGIMLL